MPKFEATATKLNANLRFRLSVNGSTVLERFKVRRKAFIQMLIVDKAALGVAYEYNECEKLLEDMKSQMEAVDSLKQSEQTKESEQPQKKEKAAKRLLASANGKNRREVTATKNTRSTYSADGNTSATAARLSTSTMIWRRLVGRLRKVRPSAFRSKNVSSTFKSASTRTCARSGQRACGALRSGGEA